MRVMAEPGLRVVSSELPDPPYPADTKANGWRPELDVTRIDTSETWVLAEDDERPWLLRMWYEAWKSVPAGTLPSDLRLLARRLGCKKAFIEAHAEILLRGWVLHKNGLLYHSYITAQVNAMLEKRRTERDRKREQRSGNVPRDNADVPRESRVSPSESHRSPAQEQETGNRKQEKKTSMSGKSPTTVSREDVNRVLLHLNERTGKSFKLVNGDGRESKSAGLVRARIREHGVETLLAVVDRKSAEWLRNDKMMAYLRPETLFNATKCEQYVGELTAPAQAAEIFCANPTRQAFQ